ncbi:LysM peptidoglycan-binding domain-containing protein [Flavihumibacter sp. R14]|nr:LysM peptidoglycan-binding domain-containing protein [Flavihumibacter soli]
MQRYLLLSIGSLLISITSLAAAPVDSIGVENLNGKKVIVHKVEAKESYYSISRKYNVSPQSVINYNTNKSLQIGVTVKVPTERTFTTVVNVPVSGKNVSGDKTAVVEYKVGPKETLYSISRKFNTSVEAIKSLNNITGNTLAAGQVLKIRYGTQTAEITPPTPVTLPKSMTEGRQDSAGQVDSSVNAGERLRLPPARYGLREVDERGIALWISDESLDGSKMLALHRTAPIGTVIKVTNTMSGKSTFAKVVGKFTENESTKDVIVVITKPTADLIGALDKRFQVNIVYGVPNE